MVCLSDHEALIVRRSWPTMAVVPWEGCVCVCVCVEEFVEENADLSRCFVNFIIFL